MRQAGRYLPGQGQGLGVEVKLWKVISFWGALEGSRGSSRLSFAFLLLSTEFRETRAAQDFFSTCRSPEACCELTLQVRGPQKREGFMPPAHYLATCLLFLIATASLPSGCCHHLLRHPCCTSGTHSNLILEWVKKGKDSHGSR